MIFALESYIKNRKAKIATWEKSRNEWVSADSYNRYNDYQKPYPVFRWGKVLPILAPVLIVTTVGATIVLAAMSGPESKYDPNNPNNCEQVVKKGDKVGIKDGTFDGSKGQVIEQRKDCSINVTLTASSWTAGKCVATTNYACDKTKENGEILEITNSSNVIKL